MMLFLQDFPQSFVFFRDWKQLKWKHFGLTLILLLPVLYVLFFDRLSTFKLILITLGVFGVILFSKFDFRNRSNWLIIMMISVAAFALTLGSIRRFLSAPSMELRSLEYFFSNPPQQWYFDRVVALPVLVFLIGIWFTFQLRRTTFVPFLLLVLYFAYMLFFMFFFRSTGFNIHPRFLLAAHIWFMLILSMGMYTVWAFLRSFFNGRKSFVLLSACLLVLPALNPRQILLPTFFQGELMPITNLVHDDMNKANNYLIGQINEDDVLIGGMYANYARWQGEPAFAQIYSYSNEILRDNTDGFSYIASIVEEHPKGWIVIDE